MSRNPPSSDEATVAACSRTAGFIEQHDPTIGIVRAGPVVSEAMPDAVLIIDDSGKIVSVDQEFELTFGYRRSEVIGTALGMLLPEIDHAQNAENPTGCVDAFSGGSMADGICLRGRERTGVEFKVFARSSPVVIPSGRYTIIIIKRLKN